MTKDEHIRYWQNQVRADFDCANVLRQAEHNAQALFWAHLCVEKSLKALWVKNNTENTPPFIHNLLRLAMATNEDFSETQLEYFNEMNLFQIKGRYPDYAESLEEIITNEICDEYLTKTNLILQCLQEKLQ
jgi:HEPN domain-containing protein